MKCYYRGFELVRVALRFSAGETILLMLLGTLWPWGSAGRADSSQTPAANQEKSLTEPEDLHSTRMPSPPEPLQIVFLFWFWLALIPPLGVGFVVCLFGGFGVTPTDAQGLFSTMNNSVTVYLRVTQLKKKKKERNTGGRKIA